MSEARVLDGPYASMGTVARQQTKRARETPGHKKQRPRRKADRSTRGARTTVLRKLLGYRKEQVFDVKRQTRKVVNTTTKALETPARL